MSTEQPPDLISKLREQRLKDAVRRDVFFLLFAMMAYAVVGYVETHASDAGIRLNIIQSASSLHHHHHSSYGDDDCIDENNDGEDSCIPPSSYPTKRIIDAGFILTTPLHSYLMRHREVNDILAMLNSILLSGPLLYVVYVTMWKGDYRLSFRLICTHLFRSLCGWFTYLPPDSQFLSSLYDFPEIFLCLFQECSSENAQDQVSFLTFFSGEYSSSFTYLRV